MKFALNLLFLETNSQLIKIDLQTEALEYLSAGIDATLHSTTTSKESQPEALCRLPVCI